MKRARKIYEPKNCVRCGKSFVPPPTAYKRQKHCDWKCARAGRKHTPEKAAALFWSRVNKLPSGCWEYTRARDKWGYGDVQFLGKHVQAHRLAWRLLRSEPGEMDVLHKCNNPPCCNPDHLYLGDDFDNSRDRVEAGRQPSGVAVHSCKLTPEQVIEIRRLKGTTAQRIIAEKYGVSQTAIGAIFRGRSWKQI